MKRRDFLLISAAAALMPAALRAKPLAYMPGLLEERLAAGEVVFLDFKASWCSTCKSQERVLAKLKAANPEYEARITFIDVDWDTYGKSRMVERMKIPRRSTLVVLKGDAELGRIVAETREDQIRDLMDTALAAAGTA